MDYFSLMERRLAGAEKNVPARLGGKRVIREFCDLIGINTPNVLQVDVLEKLDYEKLPEHFVLKPSFASTSIGVYLLKKSGDNFLDILKNKEYTWNELKIKCNAVAERYFPTQ